MCCVCEYLFCIVVFQYLCGFVQCVGCIDYVVYDYVGVVFDFIDDVYYFGDVCFWMMFVDDCEIVVELFCECMGMYDVVDVW